MRDILRVTVPLTVWLASLSAVYGLHGLVCSDRWPEAGSDPWGRAALVAVWLTAVAVALQAAFVLALRSRRFGSASVFVLGVSLTLAVVALVATAWTLMPVVTTTACLPPA